MVQIVYANENLFESFHKALTSVAKERIYIEMLEPPSLNDVSAFQRGLIQRRGATFYAVDENNQVVGWADVFPDDNPRLSHRGSLGMGIIREFRGKGIGTRLLQAVINHLKVSEIEKIELNVYSSNEAAIGLYKKLGFVQEGLITKYRKLDGRYFDCILMGLHLR